MNLDWNQIIRYFNYGEAILWWSMAAVILFKIKTCFYWKMRVLIALGALGVSDLIEGGAGRTPLWLLAVKIVSALTFFYSVFRFRYKK